MNYAETVDHYDYNDDYLDLNLRLDYMVDDFWDLVKTLESRIPGIESLSAN